MVVVGCAVGPAIVSRRLDDVPSLGVVTLACVFCAVGYAPFALSHFPSHPGGRVVASVVVLLVCAALAFALIAEAGPIRSTPITYVNPAVAVALGVVFLGEALAAATIVGFVPILSGSWLAGPRRADTTSVVPGAAVALPASRPDSPPRHT